MKIFSKIINDETKLLDCIACGDEPLEGYSDLPREIGYDGNWYLKGYAPEKPAPTYEEQKEKRAEAYRQEVDPITAHIQRLRDEEEPDEEKISELISERNEKVLEIQERYPYPVEEGEE